MATEFKIASGRTLADQGDGSGKLKRVTLAIAVIAMMIGIAAMAIDVRFGLIAAALILGWTQLVGL